MWHGFLSLDQRAHYREMASVKLDVSDKISPRNIARKYENVFFVFG